MDACNFSLGQLCLDVPNKMSPHGGMQLPCFLASVQFESGQNMREALGYATVFSEQNYSSHPTEQ